MNKRTLIALVILLLFAFGALAQTPVALAPVARQQFLAPNGTPLANGCVFTYAAGTATPQATYADSSGTFLNTNPIILDAGGFATIWLANLSYKIAVYSNGGLNCATGAQTWSQDNVSAYTILNQAQNITLGGVTADPPGSAGEIGYRSDIPCFRGFTTLWDCFTMNALAQSLTNKTIDVGLNSIINTPNTIGHYLRNDGTAYHDSAIQAADISVINASAVPASPSFCLNGTVSIGLNPTLVPSCTAQPATYIAYSTPSPPTTSGVAPVTMVTAPASSSGNPGITYRFSGYVSQTALGTSCSGNTSIGVSVVYTDPNGSGVSSAFLPFTQAAGPNLVQATATIFTNGSVGNTAYIAIPITINAKVATNVTYQVFATNGTGCSPAPQIQFFPSLEQIGR